MSNEKKLKREFAEFETDFLWGGDQIAEYMGISRNQFYYLFNNHKLDGAVKKMAHKIIVASKSKLNELIASEISE